MAYTLTQNLKLRLDSNLTSNSRYNLLKLDELGAVATILTTGDTLFRSKLDLTFQPQDASIGGSGVGGNVTFGSPSQYLDNFTVYTLNWVVPGLLPAISPLTTKGDLFTYSTVNTRLPVGTNGQVLTADSSQTTGLIWANPPATGITQLTGDILAGPGSGSVVASIAPGVIVNADVNAAAAIAGTKISPDFGSQVVQTLGSLRLGANGGFFTSIRAAQSGQSTNWDLTLPDSPGVAGYALTTDGSGTTVWAPASGGGGGNAAATWSSGTTFSFTHGLGSNDVQVSVYDINNETDIDVESITRTSINAVQLTATEAPTGAGWRVTVFGSGGTPAGVSSVALAAPASILTVSGSPITSSGTLTLGLATQAANTVWAGPAAGAAVAPAFRALVEADMPNSYLPLAGGTMAGDIVLVGDATQPLNPVTYQQFNAAIFGLSSRDPVLLATTANVTLSGEQTIDGILTSSSRILVKNQSDSAQNGIYVTAAGAWTRSTDMDTWAEVPGALISVDAGGSINGSTLWLSSAAVSGTIGITAINFTILYGPGSVDLASAQVTGILPITKGGTGATTAATARTNLGTAASGANSDITSITGLTTALTIGQGGTGQTTAGAAFNALSPMTTAGDVIYGGASGAGTRLAAGSATQVLHSGTTPTWAAVTLTTDVTGILPAANGGTGITALGTGIATWLGTPSSSNLAAAMTDETGTGLLVFATNPILTTPNLGTPSAAVLTNATGLPLTTGVTGSLPIANGGTAGTTAATARTNLGAAASGVNSDITSISGFTGAGTLDYYDEGTWTPTVTAPTPGTVTYSIQVGTYTRIGRTVFYECFVSWSNWAGSPTGAMSVAGLPFTSNATSNNFASSSCQSSTITFPASCTNASGRVGPSDTTILIVGTGSAVAAASCQAASNAGATARNLIIAGFYHV